MLRGVIFDFDGVPVDSERASFEGSHGLHRVVDSLEELTVEDATEVATSAV